MRMTDRLGLVLLGHVFESRIDAVASTAWLRDLVAELDLAYADRRLAPFGFTGGEEIQGLLEPGADPLEAVLRAAFTPGGRRVRWVAVRGEVDPDATEGRAPATERSGPAFLGARNAIDAAPHGPRGAHRPHRGPGRGSVAGRPRTGSGGHARRPDRASAHGGSPGHDRRAASVGGRRPSQRPAGDGVGCVQSSPDPDVAAARGRDEARLRRELGRLGRQFGRRGRSGALGRQFGRRGRQFGRRGRQFGRRGRPGSYGMTFVARR